MIKKKPYEKQDMKTLYNNQQSRINKQSDFENYGLESEYGFSARVLDARRQARNIIPYRTIEDFRTTYDTGRLNVELPYGEYLITGYWTTTGSGSVDVYLGENSLLTVSGNQISMPVSVKGEQAIFSLRPQNNTGVRTYNLIFISL